MSEVKYKVRATEKIYYVDSLRFPGMTNQAKEDLSVFYLQKKEDFNPNFMEPIGWTPEKKEMDTIFVKEDGSKRTAEEVASLKSDKLDQGLRAARAAKVEREQKDFETSVPKAKEVL